MAVDYDLVIIGSSWEGIYAAATAARLKARVALVTQDETGFCPNSERFIRHTLTQISRLTQQTQVNSLGIYNNELSLSSLESGLTIARAWGEAINQNLISEHSLSTLASLGVDVILGKGEFCRLPQQAFIVGKRKLQSRVYVIATGSKLVVESIEGQDEVDYLTLQNFWSQKDLSSLPQKLVLVGDCLTSLEVAQSLSRLGKNIVLVVESKQLLPHEDTDISLLIQAQLEAEKIKILTNSPVTQIKKIGNQKWLQAGNHALEAEEIIFTGKRQANIAGLNLAGVNVKYKPHGIVVNNYLQTTNPTIYAFGSVLGGYSLPNIAHYEANIILKNTLFIRWFKTDYRCLPWAIFTDPNLARVGMSEGQARQRYHNNIYVIRQYFKTVAQAQILGKTSGLLKLIVSDRGEILGCAIVGDQALELIGAIAMMMQHKIRLNRSGICGLLAMDFPYIYPSFAEIINQATTAFYQQKLSSSSRTLKFLETWFNWRRK